jgi:hypothetical protein
MRKFGALVAIACAAASGVAHAQTAEAPPAHPLAKCIGYYRIMGTLSGETRSPDAWKDYPWPGAVKKVASSKQNWAFREALANQQLSAALADPEQVDAEVQRQIKVSNLAVKVVQIYRLSLPTSRTPTVERVLSEAASCDALLGLAGN